MSKLAVAVKRILVGRPQRSDRLAHSLLPKRIALPVFASDAMSSVAYAPEEIFLTLSVAGVASYALSPWIGLAVVVVLLTVVTVPWSTDRLMRMLLPDGTPSAWREPAGTVAILPLPLHEDWVGHPVRELEQATDSRVAFIVRFGTGVLPKADTVVQHEDTVYVAAVSGTVSDVTAAAAAPPQEG